MRQGPDLLIGSFSQDSGEKRDARGFEMSIKMT